MSAANIPSLAVPMVGPDGRVSPAWFAVFTSLAQALERVADLEAKIEAMGPTSSS